MEWIAKSTYNFITLMLFIAISASAHFEDKAYLSEGEISPHALISKYESQDHRLVSIVGNRKKNRGSVVISDGSTYEIIYLGFPSEHFGELKAILMDRALFSMDGVVYEVGLRGFLLPSEFSEFEYADYSFLDNQERPSMHSAIVKELDLRPVVEGESRGYVVGSNPPSDMSEVHGLNEGDIIISINGYPVGTEYDDIVALKSYDDSGSAMIKVIKNGREIIFEYKD